MARAYSASGSRHSTVLTAAIALHVGLAYVIASGFVTPLPPVPKEREPFEVYPVEPAPVKRHAPGKPELEVVYHLPVVEPVVDIPKFMDEPASPTGQTSAAPAGPGSGVALQPGIEYLAATLRTRRERIDALIQSCYPAASRRAGEEGRAVARVVIGAQGGVVSWNVAQSSGFPRLDAAMDCVIRRLAFAPARRDGGAVESVVLLPIAFRLD